MKKKLILKKEEVVCEKGGGLYVGPLKGKVKRRGHKPLFFLASLNPHLSVTFLPPFLPLSSRAEDLRRPLGSSVYTLCKGRHPPESSWGNSWFGISLEAPWAFSWLAGYFIHLIVLPKKKERKEKGGGEGKKEERRERGSEEGREKGGGKKERES